MILNKSEPDDLFFIISLSGETHELLEVTNLLQLRQKRLYFCYYNEDNTLVINYNVYVSSTHLILTDGTDYS